MADVIELLSTDLRLMSSDLRLNEIRYLVDLYYIYQEMRKRTGNQRLALGKAEEPCQVIDWLEIQSYKLEDRIRTILATWTQNAGPVAEWCLQQKGIGPVITAGLMSHIDITKAPTVGHIWRYAGLDPTSVWEPKKKRPWNARLKTLCWKIGESFVKVSGKEDAFYGKVYLERKAKETAANEALQYEEQAKAKLARYKFGKNTEAYRHYIAGKLPPAHIHARAKRYAVKLFLSHYHEVAYIDRYKESPPKPYPIGIGGHAHYIPAPGR